MNSIAYAGWSAVVMKFYFDHPAASGAIIFGYVVMILCVASYFQGLIHAKAKRTITTTFNQLVYSLAWPLFMAIIMATVVSVMFVAALARLWEWCYWLGESTGES